jgi:hypothetical protein
VESRKDDQPLTRKQSVEESQGQGKLEQPKPNTFEQGIIQAAEDLAALGAQYGAVWQRDVKQAALMEVGSILIGFGIMDASHIAHIGSAPPRTEEDFKRGWASHIQTMDMHGVKNVMQITITDRANIKNGDVLKWVELPEREENKVLWIRKSIWLALRDYFMERQGKLHDNAGMRKFLALPE